MKTLQKKKKNLRLYVRATFVALLAGATTLSFLPSSAFAQSSGSVTVDMSVLNDGGQTMYMPSDPAAQHSGGILMPPTSGPVSRFYFGGSGTGSSSGLTLKKPGTTTKTSAIRKARKKKAETKVTKTVAPAPAAPAAPAKSPEPPVVAKAPAPKPPKPAEPVAMAATGKTPPPPPPPSAMPEPAKAVATEPTQLAAKTPPPPPPAAAPEMKSAPEPVAPPAAEVASTTPITSTPSKPGDSLLIPFDANDAKLPAELKTHLADLADGIREDKDIRLQLMAYAGGDSISAGKARRMSLSRALSVRSFLIENGIRSTRIDVRALGNKTTTDPINRVDVNISKR